MPVYELRQYTLSPGGFPVLADLFDRYFTAALEDCGMRVDGLFADLDAPDRFVWVRSFPDLAARTAALTAFYLDGPVWKAHREAANATMLDSDDVLLLRPCPGWDGVAESLGSGQVSATVCLLPAPVGDDVRAFLAEHHPGGTALGLLETHPGPNGFPRLPVREGENAVVLITTDDASTEWTPFTTELTRRWATGVHRLRLSPLPRPRIFDV